MQLRRGVPGLCFFLLVAISCSAQTTAQSVLDKWAAAIGGREKLQSLRAMYTRVQVGVGGMSGTEESWESCDGKRRVSQSIGGFSEEIIFDGQYGWKRSANGKLRELSGADLEAQLTDAYFASYAQFFPDRRRGKVEYSGDEGNAHVLRILPEGGRPVTIYLDRTTGLPVKQIQRSVDRDSVAHFDEYRDVDGLKVVARSHHSSGAAKYEYRVTLQDVQANPKLDMALFSKPALPPADIHFPNAAKQITVPFELYGDNIYVQAGINGSKPQWFIFDTGAESTVLNAPRVAPMGIRPQGAIEGRGVGEKSIDVGFVRDARFTIGEAGLDPRTVASTDLGMVESLTGRHIAGILGYDVLSSFVFSIDYARCKLTISDPASFRYTGKGEGLPFMFEGRLPLVTASVTLPGGKALTGRFLLDTGSGGAVDLNAPFVKAHRIMEALGGAVRESVGFGVGGESKSVMARIPTLTLGSFQLKQPVAKMSQDASGGGANPDQAGIIGGEVFRRFTVTFDYDNQRLYLEPNASISEPFEQSTTGIVLMAEGTDLRTYRVYKVMKDTPAAESGIFAGDLLEGFEGKPASDRSLDELEQMLRSPEKEYRLDLRREGKKLSLVIKTRRLV